MRGEGDEPSRCVGGGGADPYVPPDLGRYNNWVTFGNGSTYVNGPPYGASMWEATGGIDGQE